MRTGGIQAPRKAENVPTANVATVKGIPDLAAARNALQRCMDYGHFTTEAEWHEAAKLALDYIDEAAETNVELVAALEAAIERMEAVSESLPVHKRHKGVSKAAHVAHLAGHLFQHAKIARAALSKAKGTP